MRLEKATFGPVLRASRERRGITLAQIAAETKLGVELWAGLEDNNFTRWPKQIYARSYVRDYALRVGLDADDVVNEFCRLFPEWGDRRAETTMRGHAAIVNHDLNWQDLPAKEQRRTNDHAAAGQPGVFARHINRMIAAAIDLVVIGGCTCLGLLLKLSVWPSLAIAATGYGLAATPFSNGGFGLATAEWLIRVVRTMPASRRRLVSSRAS